MEEAPSAGKTVAIAGLSTGQAVVLLLYVVHKWGIDDMTPEVAVSIISVAVSVAATIMHLIQRRTEHADENHPAGVVGGPAGTPGA